MATSPKTAQPAQSTIGPSVSACGDVEPYAAVAVGGFEPGGEHVVADGGGHSGQQVAVHAANEVTLFVDERVERAVGEPDVGAVGAGLVALIAEHHDSGVEQRPAARSLPGDLLHSFAEPASLCRGDPGEGFGDRRAVTDRLVDRGGKEPGGEVIVAGRETDGQLTLGSPIQLRRSSGAGSPTLREAAVLRRQQPVGDKAVEVEGGDGTGHPHRRGGFILANRPVPADDEPVQPTALWFGE